MKRFKFGRQLSQVALVLFVSAVAIGVTPSYATTYVAPVAELDHFYMYSWEMNRFTTDKGGPIDLATANSSNVQIKLFFNDIRNWDSSANTLFVHMFDSSNNTAPTTMNGNVASTRDEPSASTSTNRKDHMAPVTTNNGTTFASVNAQSEYTSGVDWYTSTASGAPSDPGKVLFGSSNSAANLYAMNGGNTFLFSKDFTATAQDYTYNFTATQVINFLDYIRTTGDIAIGLDSDCHYYFTDISLIITQTPSVGGAGAVPEPASLTLLGLGLLAGARQRRKKRQAEAAKA